MLTKLGFSHFQVCIEYRGQRNRLRVVAEWSRCVDKIYLLQVPCHTSRWINIYISRLITLWMMRENVEVGNTIENGKKSIRLRYHDSNAQNFRNDSHKSNKPISRIVQAHTRTARGRGREGNRHDTQMKTMPVMESWFWKHKKFSRISGNKKRNKLAL